MYHSTLLFSSYKKSNGSSITTNNKNLMVCILVKIGELESAFYSSYLKASLINMASVKKKFLALVLQLVKHA